MTIELATVLNGSILSAKSCQFFMPAPVPIRGILACNYKEKLEAENVYDDDRTGMPVGSTSGRYSVESFSITMLRTRWVELMPVLSLMGLGSIGAARFPFVAEYSEQLDPLHTVVDAIYSCRITGIEDDYSEDIKALVTKLDLMALGMTRNGNTLFDLKRAVPI